MRELLVSTFAIYAGFVVGPSRPAFVQALAIASRSTTHHRLSHSSVHLYASATSNVISRNEHDVASISSRIEDCVANGQDPEFWLSRLEELNQSSEPNREARFLGEWHVWYTNCPPPSNGQLGPFKGTASQNIDDATTRSYQNLLAVPPNSWLTATLDGVWEDWDGVLLPTSDGKEGADGENASIDANFDWGAAHWKVTFLQLKIQLWNRYVLVDKKFPANTSRVWRTTYLDDEIRIVRAGKSGRKEDEVVFYTKRAPLKTL